MSVVYVAPAYIGLSILFCFIYSAIEYFKEGSLNSANKTILSIWCVITLLIGFIIASETIGMTSGTFTSMSIFMATILLACVTICISGIMIYWT